MSRFDRVLVIRHLAILVGAVVAYLLRQELQTGYTALAIVVVGAWLNVAAYVYRTRESLARLSLIASPVIGIGSWAALSAVTNGVSSPFVTGLFLEVVLAPMHLAGPGIGLVTLGAVGALWVQQGLVGIEGQLTPLVVYSAFLLGIGGAILVVTRRWEQTHEALSSRGRELGSRLEHLERQLADERALSSLGENAARLAHGHKNAIHSLRGFVGLIEPRLVDHKAGARALEGLKAAIDDLEQLALLTLKTGPAGPVDRVRDRARRGCAPLAELEQVLHEVAVSHPGSRWELESDGPEPELPMPAADFVEVVRILLTNSVEAMDGKGRGTLRACSRGGEFRLTVSDQGGGLSDELAERIFERGYTTKAGGSGYGLYLARKIVEAHGGRIAARPGRAGAVFEVGLPLEAGASAAAGGRP